MMTVTRRLEGLVIPTERNLLSASFSRVYYLSAALCLPPSVEESFAVFAVAG
jgi:hypothetical protein